MVVTPYLSGLNTIIEWSQHHIGFSIKRVVLIPYWKCNSRTVFYSVIVNRTVVAELVFILEAAWLIVCLAQFWATPRNVLKRATWSWLNLVTTSVDNRIWKTKIQQVGNPKTTFHNSFFEFELSHWKCRNVLWEEYSLS